jgi:hypothetical protein
MIRENFCGACMAIPLALAGTGIKSMSNQDTKKSRIIMLVIGILLLVLSSGIFIWYMRTCNECR